MDTIEEQAEKYTNKQNVDYGDQSSQAELQIYRAFIAGTEIIDMEFLYNDILNAALCRKGRIRGIPHSNKIAQFVTEYLKNNIL